MSKTIELLLTENVESLGIVGDVVQVKPGYARNFLLPFGRATEPSEEARAALAERRAEAEREMRALRSQRESMVADLEGFDIHIQRACNDQGLLYGSVTQKDIADALEAEGFRLRPRDIRLPHAIKRIDSYDVLVKPDQDLEATIKLWVVPDREMSGEEREEMEFDNEGNLIERPAAPPHKAEETEAGATTEPTET